MRLRKSHADAGKPTGEAGASSRRRREGRGWGPFTGGQLTVVIVAIAAMFAIPTAALAAGGAFTNNSATVPAVKATNANAHGIGVQGSGKKFGVYSNGNLGVANGKNLNCKGCVTPTDLSASAQGPIPLGHGQSESGVFGVRASQEDTDGYVNYTESFVRPVPFVGGGLTKVYTQYNNPVTGCSGPGHADPGYLCMYFESTYATSYAGTGLIPQDIILAGSQSTGFDMNWTISANDAHAYGEWTATAS